MAEQMFLTIDEVAEKLGITPEKIQEMVREGQLREFRSSGKQMFRREDVDQLTTATPAPSDLPSGLEDSTSEIELAPIEDSDVGSDILALDDTEKISEDEKEASTGASSGINVFDEDEMADLDTDPMAKTQIAPSVSDQISMEGAGSGSGLLDLTRESDDTSLGADLLDEIVPGTEGDEPLEEIGVAEEPLGEGEPEPIKPEEAVAIEAVEPVAVAPAVALGSVDVDPTAGVFTTLMAISLIMLGFCGAVLAAAVRQVLPGYVSFVSSNLIFFAGGAFLVSIAVLVIGTIMSRR